MIVQIFRTFATLFILSKRKSLTAVEGRNPESYYFPSFLPPFQIFFPPSNFLYLLQIISTFFKLSLPSSNYLSLSFKFSLPPSNYPCILQIISLSFKFFLPPSNILYLLQSISLSPSNSPFLYQNFSFPSNYLSLLQIIFASFKLSLSPSNLLIPVIIILFSLLWYFFFFFTSPPLFSLYASLMFSPPSLELFYLSFLPISLPLLYALPACLEYLIFHSIVYTLFVMNILHLSPVCVLLTHCFSL